MLGITLSSECTKCQNPLIAYLLEDWWNYYDGDDKLLRHSYKFLEDLIEYWGNLQAIALNEIGLKSTQEIKMTLLPVDQ